MAHKTGASATKKNRDSISKRLGVKKYGGEAVNIGNILIRQKGNKYNAGIGTKLGNDYTIYAMISGKVEFKQNKGKRVISVINS